MNGDRIASTALALCCLFALGTSAATLDASVDTTPDDVIDLDYASLPLPSDELGSLKEQVQSNPDEQGDPSTQSQRSSADGGDRKDGASRAGSLSGGSSDQSGDQSAPKKQSGMGPGQHPAPPSLLDRLLALLSALLDLLVTLLPAFLLLGSVVAGVRYRRRLATALDAVLDRFGLGGGIANGPPTGDGSVPAPSNDVERAWYEMVRRLDLADDRATTPRQVADAAVGAGVDPAVVAQVTDAFEEVRYGGAPVTEERRDRARRGIEQFRAQHRGGGRT